MMNCAQCDRTLGGYGYLFAYVEDEEQHLNFCDMKCHEKYLQRYPKYSVRELEKIVEAYENSVDSLYIKDDGVHYAEPTADYLIRILKEDKKKVEEILNGTRNAKLGKSKKKKKSTRRSRSAS